jgi:hypothetical protein
MSIPQNRQELIQYCFRSLGQGAVDVNVTAEQADDRIDEALDYFKEFHFDGVQKQYLSLLVTDQVMANQYFNLPNNVFNVTRVFPLSTDTVNSTSAQNFNIFDLNYQIRLNELYDFTSADYVYFELANEHIRTLEMLFIGDIPIRYNRNTNILYTDLDWGAGAGGDVFIGSYVVAEVYTFLPDGDSRFWGDIWLKQYATALIKRQWGANLKKFKGTPLPGGIVLDGQGIFEEAKTEIAELRELIRSTFEAPPQWEIG